MSFENLTKVVAVIDGYRGLWNDTSLALDIKMFLWESYDPRDDFLYPNIDHWDDLLKEVIESDSYDTLRKDEVLSILFGLHHRNRIVEGLWWSMFERGVTQKLLVQLLVLNTAE
jgi:hypothetical protein